MKTRKERPALRVIEGGRVHAIDLHATIDELRGLVRDYLDLARERVELAEKRAELAAERLEAEQQRAELAEEALIAERIAREELAELHAELVRRREWGLGRRLLWALSHKR